MSQTAWMVRPARSPARLRSPPSLAAVASFEGCASAIGAGDLCGCEVAPSVLWAGFSSNVLVP